jgi:solute carrier family 40 (iron-regulated transporter), member 1
LRGEAVLDHELGIGGERLGMFDRVACYIVFEGSTNSSQVVVVAAPYHPTALRTMNAQMRRIDLLCKLFGLFFIAILDGVSTKVAIAVNFMMNLISVLVEYFAIARVYYEVPELQESKRKPVVRRPSEMERREQESRLANNWRHVRDVVKKTGTDFHFYFRHHAFLPSFAGALLYLTVLSFGGQMVTYFLSAGYTSTQLGIARTFSVVFEVLATWVAPWLMGRIGPIRAGLWHSDFQVLTLVAGLVVFWVYFAKQPVISASGLVIGTILSRLGLRGFDLCVQTIVQEEVEAASRGAFSSVEAAWQSAFELFSFASTMVFSRPAQFKYPTLISVIAVAMASACYSMFARLRRGHLVHLEVLSQCFGPEKVRQEHERGIERVTSHGDV